jgi:DNA-binding IclR family transcriptional regulator
MSTAGDRGRQGTSLEKALRILRRLVESRRRWGVQELAGDLGLNVSTTHRQLRSLMSEGFVSYDRDVKLYEVGAEFLRLAAIAQQSTPLEDASRPLMRALVEECGETVCLAAYDPARAALTPLAVEESDNPLRYTVEVGALWPLHAGASGKAVLAFLPETEADRAIGRGELEALTDRTVTDPRRLERDLVLVRERGYAFSKGERIAEAVGIAAPLFDASERAVGCLLITIPSHRFSSGSEERLGPLAVEYAGRISELLGHTPSGAPRATALGGTR